MIAEFTKSAIAFPWAMSLFGVQQAANALSPRSGHRVGSAASSVQQATEKEFSDVVWAAFQVGDQVQRGAADFLFDLLSARAFSPGYWRDLGTGIARQSAYTMRVLTPGENSRLALQETQNNYEVYNLVKHVHELLHIPSEGQFALADLIEKAYALGQYPDLWAVEGLGHDYADTFWGKEPIRGVLTGPEAAVLPDKSLTMMHAGIGLSFAQHLMETINQYSDPAAIRAVLERFSGLVRDNSRPGYEGAAYESLGLVTRTWHAQMVPIVDSQLRAMSPDISSYFWHGAGRALYFLPVHILPGSLSPWQAAYREPPDEFARRNMIAGLSWASTVVNIRQPEILANMLKYEAGELAKTDAFTNGVISTVMMANDITPDDVYISSFLKFQPRPEVADLWNNLVKGPVEWAVRSYYPALRKQGRLEEIFHYRPLPDAMNWVAGVR